MKRMVLRSGKLREPLSLEAPGQRVELETLPRRYKYGIAPGDVAVILAGTGSSSQFIGTIQLQTVEYAGESDELGFPLTRMLARGLVHEVWRRPALVNLMHSAGGVYRTVCTPS